VNTTKKACGIVLKLKVNLERLIHSDRPRTGACYITEEGKKYLEQYWKEQEQRLGIEKVAQIRALIERTVHENEHRYAPGWRQRIRTVKSRLASLFSSHPPVPSAAGT
jgi:hypothetical protein